MGVKQKQCYCDVKV